MRLSANTFGQANKQRRTAQLTNANLLAKSTVNKAISLVKKISGMPSSNPIEFFPPFGSQSVTYILSYLWIQINQQLLSETSLYLS